MRETLAEIARRLREAPNLAEELALKRGAVSDRLHKILDEIKIREIETAGAVAAEDDGNGKKKHPNEQARLAEAQRRLAADKEYQALKAEADELRKELRLLDAEIERVSRRHRSDANLAYLAASLISAGMREDAEAVLAAYGAEPEVAEEPQVQAEPPKPEAPVEPEPKAESFQLLPFS
jgi:predicted transcriptional regulator